MNDLLDSNEDTITSRVGGQFMTSPLLEPSNEQRVLSPIRGVLAGEVAKALCVSAVALFVDVAMLLVLVEALGIPHLLSASLAFGLGLLVN